MVSRGRKACSLTVIPTGFPVVSTTKAPLRSFLDSATSGTAGRPPGSLCTRPTAARASLAASPTRPVAWTSTGSRAAGAAAIAGSGLLALSGAGGFGAGVFGPPFGGGLPLKPENPGVFFCVNPVENPALIALAVEAPPSLPIPNVKCSTSVRPTATIRGGGAAGSGVLAGSL